MPQRLPFTRTLVTRFATSRAGAWLFSRLASRADRLLLRLSGSRTTLTGLLTGLPMVLVDTVGRRSGIRRTIPLLCIRLPAQGGSFAVIASNWGKARHPAWYGNIKAHPQVSCTTAGETRVYLAHEAIEAEYTACWQAASRVYPGYLRYKEWAGERRVPILVFVADGTSQPPSSTASTS